MSVPLRCEGCRTVVPLADARDIDGSFKALESAGWMSFARKGEGRENWAWKCPACQPVPSTGPGDSTSKHGSLLK